MNWPLTFLLLALIAALLGFTPLAGAAAGVAQFLSCTFLLLLGVSVLDRVFARWTH